MNRAQRRASQSNGRKMMKQGWTPWEDWTDRARDTHAMRTARAPSGLERFWQNGLYSVQQFTKASAWGPITLLMVRRNDEGPIRSWSDMQRIKNELVGEDRVAVEVFPAERDLIDQANMYHLWVLPAGFNLPFGLHLREVS